MKENRNKSNTEFSELIDVEHRKYDVEISLGSQKGGVMIADKFYPNMLVRNYWRYWTGVLRGITVAMTDISSTTRNANAGAIGAPMTPATNVATLEFGTSDTAAAYTQTALLASSDPTEGTLGTWSKNVVGDETVLSISRTAATNAVREMAIQQAIYYDSSTPQFTCIFTRVVPGTPPTTGQLVTYKIKIPKPWVDLFATMMMGILTGTNVTSKDTSSSVFTMRISAAALIAGHVRLYIGTGTGAHAWTDYCLTAPHRMIETYTHILNTGDTTLVVSGFIKPASAVTVGEVGVVGYMYDTAGVAREVLLARKVLPTPIAVAANAMFTVKMDVTA